MTRRPAHPRPDNAVLRSIADRVLWLSTMIVDGANRSAKDPSGVKTGGHQASSASMVDIMVALWFAELDQADRVAVKPHASPVLHAINYLLGNLDEVMLTRFRARGGLQSYPSRRKDPDRVDFSTGSVGIGATAPIWAALTHRYLRSRFGDTVPTGGRFISLVGDAELDEGAVWEALGDPHTPSLGEVLWIVDVNRQSLDRVVPDVQVHRLERLFEASGWQVITLPWGRRLQELFAQPGGGALRERIATMPNEEYQRMLRATDPADVRDRLLGENAPEQLRRVVESLPVDQWPALVRDLGGHDFDELLDALGTVDDDRPTVIFAYTVKGNGLPSEGHPNNHSVLLSPQQIDQVAARLGMDVDDPWQRFTSGPEADLCTATAARLERPVVHRTENLVVPDQMPYDYAERISTQAAFGRFLRDLARVAPEVADRVVTTSPDVASSTNLGGWINLKGVWSAVPRHDWFDDDRQRLLHWVEGTNGQHIELGIAEVNLVSFLGELGSAWNRWGERLIPIGTVYDPFVERALEPWRYGMYAGGQSILVGTPSGVTLAPEGGAHQSISTPSVGIATPECIAWEPAFAKDLEWALLASMDRVGVEGGTSSYFRLTTLPMSQSLAQLPTDELLLERRRHDVLAGGYRLSGSPAEDEVTLVGMGAVMPQVVEAAEHLSGLGHRVGTICLTSPDLVHRDWRGDPSPLTGARTGIAERLFPRGGRAPLVSVLDGHPHALSFLGALQGVPSKSLGVTQFGQSSSVGDAHRIHGIDRDAIVNAALDLLEGLSR